VRDKYVFFEDIMTAINANGITIEYEEYGPKDGSAVILVRGLGTQLIYWPEEYCMAYAEAGHRVVLFDNRDVGLSSKLDHLGEVDISDILAQMSAGEKVDAPYTLDDMALDIIGLMDALDIARAHIVGISLGGMITQTVTGNHPDRVISMTSIMSSTGNPDLPTGDPEVMKTLLSPPQDSADREAKIADEVRSMQLTGSPGYPVSDEFCLDLAARAYDRCYHPAGVDRQMAAARALGDRRPRLQKITRPALVIHGSDDVLLPPEGGRDTAANIPGAKYVEIPGMGHDIPPSLGAKLAAIVMEHIDTNEDA
jgi:pimeloyl-ACP methyl ester carboxylesterase